MMHFVVTDNINNLLFTNTSLNLFPLELL